MKRVQNLTFIFATVALNASLMGSNAPVHDTRDYPRELGSAAEGYIEQKNAQSNRPPNAKRDNLHPDVDNDQDVEYMFEESEVW